MTFDDEPVADLRLGEAPASVIVSALRWDILNEWVRYLNDDKYPDKTAEMSYVWGFINRDFGGDALRCLWSKHETAYPLFAETVWLLHREFSEGAGPERHPLFAGLPAIPSDILFRKIANSSTVAFRKLTEPQMIEILRKAPNDYATMR
ncbi:hypothetical protein BCL80_11545 [Streptomyces avidinii]|uniref:hypothetical protein n=1 Tax=[Kitasatospora] papulosa TaxID=1464011 RepID=UPI000BCA3ABB|nr:hypothetical protein BCL80_11545 [Streptomyces avidinii]SNX80850.1 hypothetical protein SAMN05421860_11345 [Streptomyces microflavus]